MEPIIVPIKTAIEGKALDQLDVKLNKVNLTAKSISSSMEEIGKKTRFAFAASVGIIGTSIAAYSKQEQVVNSLNASLKNQGIYTEELSKKYQEQASALQKLTTFGDEEIISSQSLLQSYAGEVEITQELTMAILDLAKAKGMDLQSATDAVGKTIGSSANALGRYGIAVNSAGTVSEKMAQVMEQLTKKFGGQAIAAAQGTGEIVQIKNAIGDLYEELGKNLLPAMSPTIDAVKSFVQVAGESPRILKTTASIVALTAAVTGLGVAVGTVGGALSNIIALITKLGSLGKFVAPAIGAVGATVASVATAIAGYGVAIKETFETANERAASNTYKLTRSLIENEKEIQKLEKTLKNLVAGQIAMGKANAETGELFDENAKKFKDSLDKKIKALKDEQKTIKENRDAAIQAEKDKENAKPKEDEKKKEDQNKDLKVRSEAERLYYEESKKLSDLKKEEELLSGEEKIANMYAQLEQENAVKDAQAIVDLEREGKNAEAKKAIEDKQRKDTLEAYQKRLAIQGQYTSASLSLAQNLSALSLALTGKQNKALFAVEKAAAIANAIVSTEQGAAKALSLGPAGIPLSAVIRAAGYVNVATIAATAIKGYADGGVIGGFTGAKSGADDTLATVKTGEMVLNAGQQENLFNAISEGALGGGEIRITFDAGRFSDAFEAEIIKRRRLGISGI